MGILHFPRVPPLSLHGRTFVHTFSMVVSIVCKGWVLSFPSFGRNLLGFPFVLSSTEHFLCSCPHPRHLECGCRPGPLFHLVEVGSLVLCSICQAFPISRQWSSFAWGPPPGFPILLFYLCLPSSGALEFSSRELFGSGDPCFCLFFWFWTIHGFCSWPSWRISSYCFSDYALCEIIASVERSRLDSIFKTYFLFQFVLLELVSSRFRNLFFCFLLPC